VAVVVSWKILAAAAVSHSTGFRGRTANCYQPGLLARLAKALEAALHRAQEKNGATHSRTDRPCQISFHEWEDSQLAHRAAASLGSGEARWDCNGTPDEGELDGARLPAQPGTKRARAERFRVSEPRRQLVFGRALYGKLLGACLNVIGET